MFKFNKKNLTLTAVFIVCVLFLSSLVPALRSPLLITLKLPLELLINIKNEFQGVIFYHRNLAQNELLEKENYLLRRKLLDTEEIYAENKRLANLLSFKQKSDLRVIASRVIGSSADNWSSVIVIDKGSSSGIKRGLVAINYLGLVGRVVEVSAYTGKVMLLSDPNLSVSAISQRSRQEGLVCGTLANYLSMKYLPKDADVKVGDTVITSGLTEVYPKGILIGTVTEVGDDFSGLSRYCLIKPAVNLSNLEEVLVIVP